MKEKLLNGDTTITEAKFSVRTHNILVWARIKTLGELAELPESVLEKIRNMGKKSIAEIKQKLEEAGLKLAEEMVPEKTEDTGSSHIIGTTYLTRSAYNLLVKERIFTWEEVAKMTLNDLQQIKYITAEDIKSIVNELDRHGIELATEPTAEQSPLTKAQEEKVELAKVAKVAREDARTAKEVLDGYKQLGDNANRGSEEPIQ